MLACELPEPGHGCVALSVAAHTHQSGLAVCGGPCLSTVLVCLAWCRTQKSLSSFVSPGPRAPLESVLGMPTKVNTPMGIVLGLHGICTLSECLHAHGGAPPLASVCAPMRKCHRAIARRQGSSCLQSAAATERVATAVVPAVALAARRPGMLQGRACVVACVVVLCCHGVVAAAEETCMPRLFDWCVPASAAAGAVISLPVQLH